MFESDQLTMEARAPEFQTQKAMRGQRLPVGRPRDVPGCGLAVTPAQQPARAQIPQADRVLPHASRRQITAAGIDVRAGRAVRLARQLHGGKGLP